jgi:eukaryotic-like serine/threonine-protein kinase
MPDQAPHFKPGDKIDKYTVVKELGRGRVGAVYLVEHPILKRKSVIKIRYLAASNNEEGKARMFREADLLARVKHPSIVTLHDVGEHDGLPFLAMDLIQGKVLGTMADKEEPLSLPVLLRIMATVTGAVHHLHESDIIHMDIKPENIVVAPNGHPMVIDLGLGASTSGDPLLKKGHVAGTPYYMSPEMAGGKVRIFTPATDIWSLGVVMYEAMVGKPPYLAETAMEILKQVVSPDPVDMSPLAAKVPEYVAGIVGKCLQKKPEDRYQSADALRRALEAAVDHIERSESDTVELAPPSPGQTLLLHVEYQEAEMTGSYREYEMGNYLAGGTYGDVYRAKELLTGKTVAFKVLKREWVADADATERFRREARLLVRLSHPNIVGVHNWGRYGPTFFIAMDLLEGSNVQQILTQKGPLPVADAISMAAQVASGIAAVHEAGAVHRDLKPANIQLVGEKYVVLDFGMAHVAEADKLTMTGAIPGSPAYMSPEQSLGLPLTGASDVYAIGVTLYEAISGKLPHESATNPHEILRRIAQDPPKPITDHRDDLPPAVLEVIARTLLKNPEERPSAQEVHDMLARSVENTPLN